jgi:hypothetical protein
MLGTDTVYTVIDTSLCNFKNVPEYITTLVGADASPYFSLFDGGNTVTNATRTSVVAVVWLPNLDGTQHLEIFADKFQWQVNWMGDSGSATGRTVAGRTKWKAVPGSVRTLYADVDTTGCKFAAAGKKPPQYFTTLHGDPGVEETKGGE